MPYNIDRRQDTVISSSWLLFMVIVAGLSLVVLPIAVLVKQVNEWDVFIKERRIVKICHDGTRIYDYRGQTMTQDQEPITLDACGL
jgi:hypothetical protein